MKISGWIPKEIHTPPSLKRDVTLLPALFLFNCFEFSSWAHLGQVATEPWLLLVWLYGLVGLVPLAWRDEAPVLVFATQCVHTVAAWSILYYYIPVVGIPVALYSVAVHRSRKISLLALLASFIPNGLGVAALFWIYPTTEVIKIFFANSVFIVLMTSGAWGSGLLIQASQQRVQQLESERKTTWEAVAEERRRIARELHDIVSHAVTVIVLQAAGAAVVLQDSRAARVPETNLTQVEQSLTNIEMMGKQAMAELRRLLGVLVSSDPADHAAGLEFWPQRGLADLPTLLTSVQDSGMPVTVHEEGTRRDLDPSVDLTAYRIVQEGLTNVLKHAGKDGDPQLRLVWEDQSLTIRIDNHINLAEMPRRQALSVGHGLVGLRERAHAVGGHLHAGALRGVGYQLTATLPFAAPAVPPGVSSTTGLCPCAQGTGDQGK
jgi:signal transduction histidine kinase